MDDPLLTTFETSVYLLRTHGIRVSPGALTMRRFRGADAPEFVKVGPAVLYRRSALDAYAAAAVASATVAPRESVMSKATA